MRNELEDFAYFLAFLFVTFIVIFCINFVYTKYFYVEERRIVTEAEQKLIKNSESYIQGREQELGRLNIELQKHEVGSNTYNAIKEVGCDLNSSVKNQKWTVICE